MADLGKILLLAYDARDQLLNAAVLNDVQQIDLACQAVEGLINELLDQAVVHEIEV
jgi:hypothetical protein